MFYVIVLSTSGLVTCGSVTCDNVTCSRDNSIYKGTLKNIEMSLYGILMIHNNRWGYLILVNTRDSRPVLNITPGTAGQYLILHQGQQAST